MSLQDAERARLAQFRAIDESVPSPALPRASHPPAALPPCRAFRWHCRRVQWSVKLAPIGFYCLVAFCDEKAQAQPCCNQVRHVHVHLPRRVYTRGISAQGGKALNLAPAPAAVRYAIGSVRGIEANRNGADWNNASFADEAESHGDVRSRGVRSPGIGTYGGEGTARRRRRRGGGPSRLLAIAIFEIGNRITDY